MAEQEATGKNPKRVAAGKKAAEKRANQTSGTAAANMGASTNTGAVINTGAGAAAEKWSGGPQQILKRMPPHVAFSLGAYAGQQLGLGQTFSESTSARAPAAKRKQRRAKGSGASGAGTQQASTG